METNLTSESEPVSESLEAVRERLAQAEKRIQEFEHAEKQERLTAFAQAIAERTGVPAAILRGSSEEEIAEHAHVVVEAIKAAIPPTPKTVVRSEGQPHAIEAYDLTNPKHQLMRALKYMN